MHQESDPKHLKPIYQQYQSQIYKCSPDTMYEESRSHSIKGEEVKTIKVNNPDRDPLLYCRDSKCKWTNQSGTKDLLGLNFALHQSFQKTKTANSSKVTEKETS